MVVWLYNVYTQPLSKLAKGEWMEQQMCDSQHSCIELPGT